MVFQGRYDSVLTIQGISRCIITTSGSSTDTVLVYHSNVVCETIAPIIIELTFDFKPELVPRFRVQGQGSYLQGSSVVLVN